MPKHKDYDMKKDYANGIIYLSRNKINNQKYIGSTTASLERRKREHKYASQTNIKRGHSKFIKAIQEFGFDNFEFSIIEKWSCDNAKQLHKREGYYQVLYNTKFNGYNTEYAEPLIFVAKLKDSKWKAEWHQINKNREDVKERNKINKAIWKENNIEKFKEMKAKADKKYREGPKREELLQKKRDYGQENKEAIAVKNKIYREENEELIKQRKKEYYEKNKERLNVQVKCPCGGTYISRAKARHEKTLTHQNYLSLKV